MVNYNRQWLKKYVRAMSQYDQLKALEKDLTKANDPNAAKAKHLKMMYKLICKVAHRNMMQGQQNNEE